MDAMNAVLRNFKNIPCPSGDRCTHPNCQWKHTWEKDPPLKASNEDNTAGPGPRKRQRLEDGDDNATSTIAQQENEVVTSLKSVSPPPLKRKVPTSVTHTKPPASNSLVSTPSEVPAPQKTSQITGTSSPVMTPPGRGTKTIKPAPVKPAARKPESLNPRHLKTAPAAHEFRYRAVKMLHEQFVRLNNELKKDASDTEAKLVLSDQELIWMALDDEEKTATDKPTIYNNIIKNRILSYRRMSVAKWKEERLAEKKKKEMAAVVKTAHKPLLGPPRVVNTGLTRAQEVSFLLLPHLLTPIEGLAQYNYVPTAPTDQEVRRALEAQEASKGWEACDRCGSRFQVFPGRRELDGALTSGGVCVFHPGKTYFGSKAGDKTASKDPKRYRCCLESVGQSPGCTKVGTHVFKTTDPKRLASILPFKETPPNPLAPTDRAVCFDCEMGYTVKGLELIRLTATSWPGGEELLDVLVQPIGEILDLNSRYSGVWPEDFANAKPYSVSKPGEETEGEKLVKLSSPSPAPSPPSDEKSDGGEGEIKEQAKKKLQIVSSPAVARDLLFLLLSPETPLIGHGLENDLNAVRIIHPTLIDTVLLFPHRRGLPVRHGLKALMETHLNKAIQVENDGKITGHDSAEDARAAGELVRLKVQTEWARLQKQGWTLEDDVFVPPDGRKEDGKDGSLTEDLLKA